MLQHWPLKPHAEAVTWTFLIDVQLSTRIRTISQKKGSSVNIIQLSFAMCIVEIVSRLVSVVMLKNKMSKMFQDENFQQGRVMTRGLAAMSVTERMRYYMNRALDLYGSDMASDMLAEHASMWIAASQLLWSYSFPYTLNRPDGTTPMKIFTDFSIQVVFEFISDIVCIWIAYKAVGMSPMGIFVNIR